MVVSKNHTYHLLGSDVSILHKCEMANPVKPRKGYFRQKREAPSSIRWSTLQGYNIAHACPKKIPRAIEGHFPVLKFRPDFGIYRILESFLMLG
jgi:hypothetical protein